MIVKLENGENRCPACLILQFYCNKGIFRSDIQCLFCSAILTNQMKQEIKQEVKEEEEEEEPEK